HARLDLSFEVRCRGHHDVVAATARTQLGVQCFIGVVVGSVYLDTRLLLEPWQRCRRKIIGPDIEVQDPSGIGGTARVSRRSRFTATASAQQQPTTQRQNHRPTYAEHKTLPHIISASASYIAAGTRRTEPWLAKRSAADAHAPMN